MVILGEGLAKRTAGNMNKISTLVILIALQLSVGSSSPLTQHIPHSLFNDFKAEISPQAIDFSEIIKATVNNLIQNNFSQPLVILPPNTLPVIIELGELITDGSITGQILLNGISIDLSSASMNESLFVAENILKPFNVSVGLALPELTISGFYQLNASFANLVRVTGDGSYSISLQELFLSLFDGVLQIFGGPKPKFTQLDYKLGLGGVAVDFQGLKLAGVDATKFVNQLINEMISVQILPYLLNVLEPQAHVNLKAILLAVINLILPSLLQ